MTKINLSSIARLVVASLMVFACYSLPAFGCSVFKAFDVNEVRNADVVFRGTLTNFQPGNQESRAPAVLTFQVNETLFGEVRESWTLKWYNSTFGRPTQWKRAINQIVAARTKGIEGQPAGSFIVHQVNCSSPFLLDDDEENRTEIESALRNAPK